MYRDLHRDEQEGFGNLMTKFTAYAAQAGIADSTMKQEDLIDKVARPLPLPLPLFTDLREPLGCSFVN